MNFEQKNLAVEPNSIGVVLAGGRSSRMGQDKSLLIHQQLTLLELSKKRLLEAGCGQVMVSCNRGKGVADLLPNLGPLGGIHSIIHYMVKNNITAQWLTIIPVDMPLLSSADIRYLMQEGKSRDASVYFMESPMPCFIQYSEDLAEKLGKLLASEQKNSIKNFLTCIGAVAIDGSTPEHLINTNTPKEWESIDHSLV